MISKLKGLVEEIGDTYVVLDVQGVGYHLTCSAAALSQLPHAGKTTTLWTQMLVREDDISLIGFYSPEERRLFKLLTSVQGVGTRVGLALLSVGSAEDMLRALSLQDQSYLTKADGVGPKLAARIVNELKDKMGAFSETGITTVQTLNVKVLTLQGPQGLLKDATQALVGLGYRLIDATSVVTDIVKNTPELTVQEVIRLALAQLSKS
ncbi:MAG: Holliday junction branch migration protein RuvA [Alphaproteobacteria bacterium]|nr:Holliday junction branch migration protein RuvA [Alphaproteobacteria bacterium]